METFIEHLCRTVFGWLCHQDPTLLNYIDGKPIWLCPRCSGLQLGLLFSFLAARLSRPRVCSISRSATLVLLFTGIVLGVDWSAGQLGWYSPTVASRLLTGLVTGAAAGILLVVYRRSLMMTIDLSVTGLRVPSVLGLVAFAVIAGWLAATQTGWLFLSGALFLTVLANVLLVFHTVLLILKLRYGRVVSSQSPQT